MEPNQYENQANLQNLNTLNKENIQLVELEDESLQQYPLSHCFRDEHTESLYRESILKFSSLNKCCSPRFQHRLLVFSVTFFTVLVINILGTLLIHIDMDLSRSLLIFKLLVVALPSFFLAALLIFIAKNRGMHGTRLEFLEIAYVFFVIGLILNHEDLCEYFFDEENDGINVLASVLVLMFTSQFLVFVNYLRFMFWNLLILIVYIVVSCTFTDPSHEPILQSVVFLVAFAGCTISFYWNEQFIRLQFKRIYSMGEINVIDIRVPDGNDKIVPLGSHRENQEPNRMIGNYVTQLAAMEDSALKVSLEAIGKDWNLNIFNIPNPILATGRSSLADFSIYESLSISEEKSFFFFSKLESLYKDNFYHNSIHAADVLSSYLFFINHSHLRQSLSKNEVLSIVISSLAHDVAHPGVNNKYLINTSDKIAIQYNDCSVLEMMHASMTFDLLRDKQCSMFEDFPKQDWTYTRKLLIELILATDMAKHFDLMKVFSNKEPKAADLDILKCGIKAADIGHSAKPWDLHFEWSVLLMKEFFNQGDVEKQQGLEVSFNCDRDTTNIPKGQVGFIGSFVIPLYKVLSSLLASDTVERTCMDHLNANLKKWEIEFQDFKIE